ncbi:MAG: hypothetical protein ACI8U3_002708 [Brevundimonas sp.]|jgi:hypothetical protein|uniref:hypothetical protein n=1 Tax=Brevundimonas sp. TaxID=1871086 RepID=UPI0039E2C4BC
MRSGAIPFQFDVSQFIARAKRMASNHVGDVTLNLPFVSVAVSPRDREKAAAREIVIRLRDRRVLSSHECCDNCIDASLASLQEIRAILVDQQVALSDFQDGPLFLMIDMIRQGIRQFVTYEERLRAAGDDPTPGLPSDFRRDPQVRQDYFDALELLRAHVSHCLHEIRTIADMDEQVAALEYAGPWLLQSYVAPALAPPRA